MDLQVCCVTAFKSPSQGMKSGFKKSQESEISIELGFRVPKLRWRTHLLHHVMHEVRHTSLKVTYTYYLKSFHYSLE